MQSLTPQDRVLRKARLRDFVGSYPRIFGDPKRIDFAIRVRNDIVHSNGQTFEEQWILAADILDRTVEAALFSCHDAEVRGIAQGSLTLTQLRDEQFGPTSSVEFLIRETEDRPDYQELDCPAGCKSIVRVKDTADLSATGTCFMCKSEWILTNKNPLAVKTYSCRPTISFRSGLKEPEPLGLIVSIDKLQFMVPTKAFVELRIEDKALRSPEKRARVLQDYAREYLYPYPEGHRPSTFYDLVADVKRMLSENQPRGSILMRLIEEMNNSTA